MSALPYSVVIPILDNSEQTKVGLVITDIASIKPYRRKLPDGSFETDNSRSIVFMKSGSFHFSRLSVEEIRDLINDTLDGIDE